MSIVLRPYQTEAINTLWSALVSQNRALIQAATGAGKTEIFIAFLQKLISKQNVRVCVAMERVDLVEQTARRFFKAGLSAGIFCKGLKKKDLSQRVTICSVQSIPKDVFFDLLIVDEVHHINPEEGRYFRLLSQSKKVVGFSATPYNSRGLLYGSGKFFPDLTYTIPMKQLIGEGFLVRPIAKKTEHQFDTSQLQVRMGEYTQEGLDALAMDFDKIAAQVKDALPRLEGRKKIAWQCVNIAHSEKLRDELEKTGELCTVVHSNLDWDDRVTALRRFTHGDARHITFVSVLTEGFDHPPIDSIVLMRPTRSAVLYVQVVGRGLRPFAGKSDCLVLDYGKVVENLGPVDNPVIKRSGKQKGEISEAPMKFCPVCFSYLPIAVMCCGDCGHEFLKDELKNVERKPDENAQLLDVPQVFVADKFSVHDHVSKSGNKCVYISYDNGFTDMREYFMEWGKFKLEKRLKSLEGGGEIHVEYKKDGKYNKIISVRKVHRERDTALAESSAGDFCVEEPKRWDL